MVDSKKLKVYKEAINNPPYRKDDFEKYLPEEKKTVADYFLGLLESGDEGIASFEKIMLMHRLPMSKEIRSKMVAELGKRYGFKVLDDLSEEETENLEFGLHKAFNAEAIGINPKEILSEEDEIRKYMADNIRKSDVYDEYTTSKVISFVVSSLKISKIYEFAQDKHKEASGIRAMNSVEWRDYSRGIKWSQMPKAKELDMEGTYIESKLLDNIACDFGYKYKDEKLEEVIPIFQNAPIVKKIVDQYAIEKLFISESRNFLDTINISRK